MSCQTSTGLVQTPILNLTNSYGIMDGTGIDLISVFMCGGQRILPNLIKGGADVQHLTDQNALASHEVGWVWDGYGHMV